MNRAAGQVLGGVIVAGLTLLSVDALRAAWGRVSR